MNLDVFFATALRPAEDMSSAYRVFAILSESLVASRTPFGTLRPVGAKW